MQCLIWLTKPVQQDLMVTMLNPLANGNKLHLVTKGLKVQLLFIFIIFK
jgi:hypothetical protein